MNESLAALRWRQLQPVFELVREANVRAMGLLPPLYVAMENQTQEESRLDWGFTAVEDDLKRAFKLVAIDDDGRLQALAATFFERCKMMSQEWFAVRLHRLGHKLDLSPAEVGSHFVQVQGGVSGMKGDKLAGLVHTAYVELARHIEGLLQ